MRALEIGHGGIPSPVLLARPYTGYVGVDSGIMQARLEKMGHGDLMPTFGETCARIEDRLASEGGIIAGIEGLYEMDIADFTQFHKGDLFDTVYMANVLGDGPESLSPKARVGRFASILHSAAKMLSEPGGHLWVVEAFTPPDIEEVAEAASVSGLGVEEVLEGDDFWSAYASLSMDGESAKGDIARTTLLTGSIPKPPYMLELTRSAEVR